MGRRPTTSLERWTRSPRRSPGGEITPGEAETIAGVVETFVRAIETTKKEGSGLNLLEILAAGDSDEDDPEENCDGDDYDETGEYEETDDYNS